jgi:hypothetical protein
VDLVRDDSATLAKRLGGEDKRRMDQYFAEVVSLEKRIDSLKTAPACPAPPNPGTDPVIGGQERGGGVGPYDRYKDPDYAWSNETLRAEVLTDFIALAFSCDITRVAALRMTMSQSYMNTLNVLKIPNDLHGLGHYGPGGSPGSMADGFAWHVRFFSRLAAKLKARTDPDGTPVLHRTAMCMFFEGGYGYDPQADDGKKDFSIIKSPHSTENMVVLVGGGAALGMKSGQHVACNNQRHPGEVVLTCLNAVGVRGPLGDLSGNIPELGVAKS